jgi:hypothetical protein
MNGRPYRTRAHPWYFAEAMKSLFEVFSHRRKPAHSKPLPITAAFRNRVFLLCRDTFSVSEWGGDGMEFWKQIHQKFQYLHGSVVLTTTSSPRDAVEDTLAFLQSCSSDHFLDFLEYMFRVDVFWRFTDKAPQLVEAINTFFRIDSLPYHLTDYIEVHETDPTSRYAATTIRVAAYPQVVLREHQFVHEEITAPVLTVLSDPAFESANKEFLEALDDYRKGDLGDCLTKCSSAFESVLKIICAKKRWKYEQTDTTAKLLSTVLANTSLASFFEQPLLLIATIRNRLSKSHGAGVQTKDVSPQVARFALNATASAILLLVEETR